MTPTVPMLLRITQGYAMGQTILSALMLHIMQLGFVMDLMIPTAPRILQQIPQEFAMELMTPTV